MPRTEVHAIILAAGVGSRLELADGLPKALMEIGGQSLMARQLQTLARLHVSRVTVCLGHGAAALEAAIQQGGHPAVHCVLNPDYRLGSVRSLWSVRAALTSGADILVLDADVLACPSLLARLVNSPLENCLLLDRDYPPDDEAVKICVRHNAVVEFRKRPDPAIAWDFAGESVGYFKFAPAAAAALARLTERYVTAGLSEEPHEEAIRDLLLCGDYSAGFEDITGTPWIEIDFPADLRRARDEIWPKISCERH